MKTQRLLLFDLDGTLVSTGGAGISALKKIFHDRYRLKDPLKDVTVAGNTDPNIIQDIVIKHLPQLVLTEDLLNTLMNAYLEELEQEVKLSADYQILPGIQEILDLCHKNPVFLLGLGTGNFEKGARIKLERGRLNQYFEFGGFGSDASDRTELLEIAIKKAEEKAGGKILKSHIFVIGDTPLDIQHGKAVGALTLAVATGPYNNDILNKQQPDYCFTDLSNTRQIIDIFMNPSG